MAKITKILHLDNRDTYCLVNVLLDDGTEAVVAVGGEVEVGLHKGVIAAWVKKGTSK